MTSKVFCLDKVILKMTLGKEVTIFGVLIDSDIPEKLILGALLSKNKFRLIFEYDKIILTKNGMYAVKW